MSGHPLITDRHRSRLFVQYARQSSEAQVRENIGSTLAQLDTSFARELGWAEDLIQVRDADLGASADRPGSREEFERLITDMKADRVGAVRVNHISRIARNEEEHGQFLYAARIHDVRLIIRRTVYDLNDPDQARTAGLAAVDAVQEHRGRIITLAEGKQRKLGEGWLLGPTPIGIVAVRGGGREKHSDDRVRERIQLVFDQFWVIRTGRGIVRYLRKNGLQLPRRTRHGGVKWVDATPAMVRAILTNPAYAGAYVSGKRRVDHSLPPYKSKTGKNPHPRTVATPPSQQIAKTDAYPGYITWAQHLEIQEILKRNHNTLGGPPNRGDALLHRGHLRCDIHGKTFKVLYHDRERRPDGSIQRGGRYACVPTLIAGESKVCCSIRSSRVDAVLEDALLHELRPSALPVLDKLLRQAQARYEAEVRAREEELRRAERLVAEFEHEFYETPFTQRLVKEKLRARWQEAEQKLKDLKARYARTPLVQPVAPGDEKLAKLRQMLERLPELWRHPAMTPQRRQSIAWLLVNCVHVTPGPEVWTGKIEWAAGPRTTFTLYTERGVEAVVEKDHRRLLTPDEIVEHLRALGGVRRRSLHAGEPYDAAAVRRVIRRVRRRCGFDQQAYSHIHGRERDGASYQEIADELNTRGIPHWRGPWTRHRIRRVVFRMRQRDLYGLGVLPARPQNITPHVVTVYESGMTGPNEIADRLLDLGLLTCTRQPLTASGARRLLREAGHPIQARRRQRALITRDEEVARLWKETGTLQSMVTRANSLGLLTRGGKPWSTSAMSRKLESLELYTPPRRGPYRRPRAVENTNGTPSDVPAEVPQDDAQESSVAVNVRKPERGGSQ